MAITQTNNRALYAQENQADYHGDLMGRAKVLAGYEQQQVANTAPPAPNTSNLSVRVLDLVAATQARTLAMVEAINGGQPKETKYGGIPQPSSINDRLQIALELISSINGNLTNIAMILGLEV